MTDEIAQWDNDPLEKWEPTAAQRARALELWHLRASDSPEFPAAFTRYCDDVLHERALPQALLALLDHATLTAVGSQGQDRTCWRLAGDVAAARDDITRWGEVS